MLATPRKNERRAKGPKKTNRTQYKNTIIKMIVGIYL
jgi:hypothetical protein